MIAAAQALGNFTFQGLESSSVQQRSRRQGWTGDLVLQKIQVRVVQVGRFGAAGWKLRVARLGIQTPWITPGYRPLLCSKFGKVMSTVSKQGSRNSEQEARKTDHLSGFLHRSSLKAFEGRWTQQQDELPLLRGCGVQPYVSPS